MTVRTIIRMGHPTLRTPARPLAAEELGSAATQVLLADMIDTLHASGGIGLAAPQIDEPVRLAIIAIPGGSSRYGDIPPMPLTVFANPTIEILEPTTAGFWEGCLSIPGLRGFVERPQHIVVRYQRLDGVPCELELRGFLATVFQHELDHLDGRLYIDRMTDTTKLMFEDEYQRFVADADVSDQL
jgi:peptide deformylase